MLKYEFHLHGNFVEVINSIHSSFRSEMDLVGENEYRSDSMRCLVRIYGCHVIFGTRTFLSLTFTLIENEEKLFLSIISAGEYYDSQGRKLKKMLNPVLKAIEEFIYT